MWQESLDDVVDGLASSDHHHDLTWTLYALDEGLDLGEAKEVLPCATTLKEALHDGGFGAFCTVIDGDLRAIALHVESEVLAHDCKADEADI